MFRRPPTQWKFGLGLESLGGKTWFSAIVRIDQHLGADNKPEPSRILEAAEQRLEQGAQLLDLEAFPPSGGLAGPSADEELRRFVPVLKKLVPRIGVPMVATTSNSETAERVAGLGADVIRDPSGLRRDPNLAKVVKPTDAGLLVGDRAAHSAAAVGEAGKDVVRTIVDELGAAANRAAAAEIDARRIAVEPSFADHRRTGDNPLLLRHLSAIHKLRRPLAVTLPGARFTVDSVRVEGHEREAADAAAIAIAVLHGAHVIRAVDIAAARRAAYVAESLLDEDSEK